MISRKKELNNIQYNVTQIKTLIDKISHSTKIHIKKSLKIPKGESEAVIPRGIDNAMLKRQKDKQ